MDDINLYICEAETVKRLAFVPPLEQLLGSQSNFVNRFIYLSDM